MNNQLPRYNNQIITNNQISITKQGSIKRFDYWILRFGICLYLVSWLLVIGQWSVVSAWRITPELQKELAAKQAAVRANSKDPDTRFDLAITMAYTNNIQDGWNNLKKVVELDPDYRPKGLAFYIQKVTENPNDWRLRFRLAFAYYFNDKKKDAIRELDNVLKIDPYNVWGYGYIALIYGELGDTDTAMDYTMRGLKIDSNVAALHLLLGEGYNRKGDKWKGFLETMEALRLRALGY